MLSKITLWFLFIIFPGTIFAQLPEGFYEQVFARDFDQPMGITFDHMGQMLVWEKAGQVMIVDTTGQRLPNPLIDIREEVSNWKDHGLMGFALDPNYENNGYFYLLYALDLHHYRYFGTSQYNPDTTVTTQATIGRVTRYTADPATNFTSSLPQSRKILMGEVLENGIPLLYEFHGLGSILAAEDGTLLISCGDATSNHGADVGGDSLGTYVTQALELGILTADQDLGSYKAQYLGSYSGKILRIDAKTGDGLTSNPFFDLANPRSPQSRIWASGFRNPYRIALWPNTSSHFAEEGKPGVILAGDVGNGAYEELNLITQGGQNFGWPIWEGVGWNTGFSLAPTPANPMAPNPLLGINGCTKEYLNFRDLLAGPVPGGVGLFPNPCNPSRSIPASFHPTEISIPVLAWSNARWNRPTRTLLMIPDEENNSYKTIHIDDPDSPISGERFDGYSSLSGAVYHADLFPEEYRDKYFAIDYSGWIKVMTFDDDFHLQSVEPFYNGAKDIHHLSLNPKDGALYFLNLTDEVRRIGYGGNPPPTAVIQADRFYGPGPLTVQFDGSSSYDAHQPIVSYEWDFGDGTNSNKTQPTHIFQTTGTQVKSFIVRLTVTDSLGAKNTSQIVISLNNTPPTVQITSFQDGDQFQLDKTSLLILDAAVSDKEHTPEELEYQWKVYLHHNDHFHPDPTDYDQKTFTLISPIGCDDQIYWYRIELTVTDPGGLSTTDIREIFPFCAEEFVSFIDLTAERTPTGIQLEWQTQLEKNIANFEIQRSTNFFDFQTIGSQIASGNASTYSFEDTAPNEGSNIYRIKVRTQDQAYTYSPFATVVFLTSENLQVFPNPARDFFTLRIQSPNKGLVFLEIFAVNGQRLVSTNWEAVPNQEFRKQISTSQFSNGTYFYRFLNGDEQKVGRLIILK